MGSKEKKFTNVNLWGNIDFNTVKQRINRVNGCIEKVLQKYEIPPLTDDLGQKKH